MFPSGSTEDIPLLPEGVKQLPVFKPDVDPDLKVAITLAKHTKSVKFFHKDGVNASILSGRYLDL